VVVVVVVDVVAVDAKSGDSVSAAVVVAVFLLGELFSFFGNSGRNSMETYILGNM